MKSLHFAITGASRGIGLELTTQCLSAGHKVSVLVRKPETATQLLKLKQSYVDRLFIQAGDVNSAQDISRWAEAIGREPIDVLINNAGVYLDRGTDFETVSEDALMQAFAVNAVAPLNVTRRLLPLLQKSQNPKVANITSLMGSIGDNTSGGSYAYRMSKAALNMMTKSFSVDYPDTTILTLHPGWVKTDMGGDEAPTQPHESAAGLLKVVKNAEKQQSGRFYDFEGDELPW